MKQTPDNTMEFFVNFNCKAPSQVIKFKSKYINIDLKRIEISIS